jgi:hypothetical protein
MKPNANKGLRKPATKSAKTRTSSSAANPARKTKPKASAATAKAAPARVKTAPTAPAAAKAKKTSGVTRLKIPPILLEGDAPPAPAVSGPGQRYALGPTSAGVTAMPSGAELPDAYGTQQLFLVARDPHWLYAHWDFTREQLKNYNSLSPDGHLVLRVFRGTTEGEPISEIQLHPESRSWFAPVQEAGAKYVAELGYLVAGRQWVSLARSGATFTPPDSLSDDTSIRFATIPAEVPFAKLLALVQGAVREHTPLVEAMQQMRAQGFKELPAPDAVLTPWTPAQEKALAEVISIDHVRRIWIGSLEITELIRRQILQHVSSIGAAEFSVPTSPTSALSGPGSVSSPFGGAGG